MILAPNGAEYFRRGVDNGEFKEEPALSSDAENQSKSAEYSDESGGEEVSENASEGQPESTEDRESGGGGEGSPAESISAEENGESGGECTTNRAMEANRGAVRLEVVHSKQQYPASSREGTAASGKGIAASRGSTESKAGDTVSSADTPSFSIRHPMQVAGGVMSQRERTLRCFRRGIST